MVRTSGMVRFAVALLAAGCGKDANGPTSSSGAGTGGDDSTTTAGMSSGGGNAGGGAGSAGTTAMAGAGGQGGAPLVGIGNGELDATCMARTSNHIPGERITLRSAVTAEGDKAFIGFYDNEKKAECAVVQDAEGKYRCMPPADEKDMNNRYFLDDKCSDEVMYKGICGLDYEAVPVTDDLCDDRRRIVPLGEPLPDTMVYAGQPGGECKPYGSLNRLYRPGTELVASEYAEVKPALWRGKGRIWTRGYEGAGDLHLVTSFLDSQLEQRCAFRSMPDGLTHCAPNRLGQLGKYTDATCKEVLLDGRSLCNSPPPTYASYSAGDQCAPGLSLARAEAPFEDPIYSRGMCMPATDVAGPVFSTKVVPDSDFLALESQVASSDPGRLKPRYLTATDGGCFFTDWWDEELQTVCSFASQYAGAPYYCLPEPDPTLPGQAIEAFTDPDCKTPVVYVRVPSCDGAKPPKYLTVPVPSCVVGWSSTRPVDPTPAVLPAALYVQSGGTCELYTPDATSTYYGAGAEMPSSMFMQATPEP